MSLNKKLFTGGKPPPPDDAFNILEWTGNNTTNNVTGAGFNPDLFIIRDGGGATTGFNDTRLIDTTRGTRSLNMNHTIAQHNEYGYNFLADGIQLTNSNSGFNRTGNGYYGYMWRANGGTEVTNNDGTQTSYVQANTDTGFSMIRYTGTGNYNDTFGHGLNSAPEFVIAKSYSDVNSWGMYLNDGSNQWFGYIGHNAQTALSTTSTQLVPNATSINAKHVGTNDNNKNYMFWAWHSVPGYSKFGSYFTNASTKIPLDFEADFFIFKYGSNGDWYVQDVKQYDGTSTGSHGGKLFKNYWRLNMYQPPTPVSTGGVEVMSDGFYPTNWFDTTNGTIFMAFKIQP